MERLDRSVRRRLLKEDETWIGKPLGANPPRRVAEAHVRHLALMLRDTGIAHRAVAAATYAATLFDISMAQTKSGPVACSKGCHHCCTMLVMVTIPDIFRLAQSFRNQPEKIAAVSAAAAQAQALTRGGDRSARLACPVLKDQACSAYADRPIPCRFLLSKSLEACVRVFVENSDEAFPYTDGTTMVRRRLDQIVQAALLINGLKPYHYELIQALDVALTEAHAEERWLAGEMLFTNVPVNAVEFKDPATGAAVEQLAAGVAATL